MRGYIEVKEDSFEDTIEHLHRIKLLACKLIKKLSESSEIYDHESTGRYEDDFEGTSRSGHKSKGRYEY